MVQQQQLLARLEAVHRMARLPQNLSASPLSASCLQEHSADDKKSQMCHLASLKPITVLGCRGALAFGNSVQISLLGLREGALKTDGHERPSCRSSNDACSTISAAAASKMMALLCAGERGIMYRMHTSSRVSKFLEAWGSKSLPFRRFLASFLLTEMYQWGLRIFSDLC